MKSMRPFLLLLAVLLLVMSFHYAHAQGKDEPSDNPTAVTSTDSNGDTHVTQTDGTVETTTVTRPPVHTGNGSTRNNGGGGGGGGGGPNNTIKAAIIGASVVGGVAVLAGISFAIYRWRQTEEYEDYYEDSEINFSNRPTNDMFKTTLDQYHRR